MSKIEIKHPEKAVITGAYSAAVSKEGWVFISGQGPLNLMTGEVIGGTIEEETLLTLSHIKKMIEAAGGNTGDILKCTVHLADINEFERFDAVYASFFQGIRPARTTVQSVLADGIKIEIDAIAKI
jgi:2-iminobutanoate/2-iminopropanoate deaminase